MDVNVSETVQCPFCGQSMGLVVDTTISQQRFTTDCEVCCRPFEVFAECEPGEIVSLETQGLSHRISRDLNPCPSKPADARRPSKCHVTGPMR